jgi:Ca2+-binding EF-hand superfamily protein
MTARQLVKRFDSDGDGRLSRQEFHRPPKLFARIDADHDGFVTASELEANWRRLAAARGGPSP